MIQNNSSNHTHKLFFIWHSAYGGIALPIIDLKFHKWTELSWPWSQLLDQLLKNNATLLITLDSFSLSFPHWKPKASTKNRFETKQNRVSGLTLAEPATAGLTPSRQSMRGYAEDTSISNSECSQVRRIFDTSNCRNLSTWSLLEAEITWFTDLMKVNRGLYIICTHLPERARVESRGRLGVGVGLWNLIHALKNDVLCVRHYATFWDTAVNKTCKRPSPLVLTAQWENRHKPRNKPRSDSLGHQLVVSLQAKYLTCLCPGFLTAMMRWKR